MGRSLFRDLNRRFGEPVDAISRRRALQLTLATGAALLVSNSALAMGMRALGARERRAGGKRVVVIGAGFGGLACAHELKSVGYDVTVVEARERVGGRVLSFADFIPGRNIEGGAELIGSNHPTWVAYAAQFGLEFLEIEEKKDITFPVVIDGKRLDDQAAEALWDEMGHALSQLDPLAEGIDADKPWEAKNAAELDKRTVQAWIDALDVSDLVKKACWINQTSDNGVEPKNASLLGMLCAIKGGGLDKYWTDTEVYRCKGGNAQLAQKLVEAIGADRVVTGLPVTEVRLKNNAMSVTCKDGRTIACDDVVLAVPPSVWSRIEFYPLLPPSLKPQMGVNVKYLAHTKLRFWDKAKASPDALSNGPVNMTWDGTDGQEGDLDACLVAFSGGPSAEKCLAFDKAARDSEYAKSLSSFYPQWKDEFVKARFMDWPRDPLTMASYSFPAPGQVTTQGPMLARGTMDAGGQARLHFAGEHACYKFVGYMEGGLNSGASVARRLALRDGLVK